MRYLDAQISFDKSSPQVNQIIEGGLKRTSNDLDKSRTLKQNLYGLNLAYQGRQSYGINISKTTFNKSFTPTSSLYRKFDFRGNQVVNTSAYYSLNLNNTWLSPLLFGELALSFPGQYAIFQGLIIPLNQKLDIGFSGNLYHAAYVNFHSIDQLNGRARSESNFLSYLHLKNNQHVIRLNYEKTDFNFLKYQIDAPSSSSSLVLQVDKENKNGFQYSARLKRSLHQKNESSTPIYQLMTYQKTQLRFQFSYPLGYQSHFQTRIEFIKYQEENKSPQSGFLFFSE